MVAALAGVAHADASKPDRGAEEKATEANLESNAPREGVTIGLVLGGATFVGAGTQDAIGRGTAISARLGHVATPRTVITFELTLLNMLHDDAAGALHANTNGNILAGAQYYTSTNLWVRFAGGLGGFTRTGYVPMTLDTTMYGPAALFGIGVDLFRRSKFTLDVQGMTIAMVNSEGVLVTFGLGLGVNYY